MNEMDPCRETKHLVVITNGGIYWLLWTLDYINKLVDSGESVVVVDISEISAKYTIDRIYNRLRRLYRFNGGKKLIATLQHKSSIKIYRPRLKLTKNWRYRKFYLPSYVDFQNGLDAEYFEEVGQRVLQEDLLKKKILKRAKKVFNFTYGELIKVINHHKITDLVVSGGRTLIPAACIAAAKASKVNAHILESNERDGYFLYPSNFRTNSSTIQKIILESWNNSINSKYKIAQDYLNVKLFREDFKHMNYADTFVNDELLDELSKIQFVVFFLTSGFEFLSFPGNELLGDHGKSDQIKKVKMFSKIAKDFGFIPVVRGHPQRPGHEKLSAIDDPMWSNLCVEIGAIYISSERNTSSYELMKISALNAVYVSSAAIDSLILGAQTIVLGNAAYAHLVPELCAFDEDGIRDRFKSINRKIEIERVYPYAYHMATFGQAVTYASITDTGDLFYKGKLMNAPRNKFLALLLKRS
jgi:hypothetical protein